MDTQKCCLGDGELKGTSALEDDKDINPKSITDMAEVFKALGDERRLEIVKMISDEPGICACVFLDKFDLTQPTLSHHMRILCSSGLVKAYRKGKWSHYVLAPNAIEAIAAFTELLNKEAFDPTTL